MGEDTWTVERFQLELLNAEKTGQFTCNDLDPLWEKAKSAIQNEEEAVSLYTTYIYLTLRLLKKQGSTDFTKVEDLFEEVSSFIVECFEQYSESSIQLEKNYAYFLYTKMGKAEKAREIWARLLEGETGPFAWLEAISLERNYGDVENARRLFYKALDNVNFRPHTIYSAFIQFEREEGNRSDLDNALERVNLLASSFIKNEKEEKQQQRKRRNFDGKQQKNEGRGDKKPRQQKIEKNGNNLEEKRRLQQKKKQQKNDSSKNEEMDIDIKEEDKEEVGKVTFQTSNIPIGPIIPGINDQKSFEIKEKNNDIEMEQQQRADIPSKKSEKQAKQKQFIKMDKPEEKHSNEPSFPYATGLEKNKLFVKHLHFGVKEAELKKFFSKFGKVLDVRIITKWNGRSKGCAYIDFETDSEASAAILGANREKIRGKEIEVYLSNPPEKKIQPTDNLPSTSSTTTTSFTSNNDKNKEHPQKSSKNSLNFIPRAATQRIGKASRLMFIPKSISKNTLKNDETNGKEGKAVNSPMCEITQSTEEISMGQK
ncbi:hypothetical protein ACQ4LE_000435 [Meloidogyne hapla]|uniref:RRM domain-containing protein n=1 Tax=Meloidogyne hapla TaxID=6305 RepID=A0A1I8BYE1_MELHA